jgi:tetratricopeptide (TPR) repeat protein
MLPVALEQHFQVLIQGGYVDELVDLLLDTKHKFPDEPNVHHLLGWARTQQRRFDEAIGHFREAVRLNPQAAGALNNLGLLLLEQERHAEALDAFKAAVSVQPAYVEALTNLSLALCRVNLCDNAVFFLNEALRLDPTCADAHHYLGFAYLTLGRVSEAEQHLVEALRLKPGFGAYLSTLGLLREKQHRAQEATVVFQQAVNADPTIAEPWNNLGNIQAAYWGRYDLALECFNQTLAIRPLYADAKYHRGMVELSLGDFEQGWIDYDFRPTIFQKSAARYDRPRWQGEPLAGKTILLHAEQGLGDTLQFIRYAEHLKNLGATVFCEVQKALTPLLARTRGVDLLIPQEAPLPGHDYQIPLLSVARLLGIRPNQPAYLFAPEDRLDSWKARVAQIPGVKIGIAWQGEANFKYDWLRSIPLSEFAPLAQLPGYSLVSLQKYNGVDQIATNRQSVPVVELNPEIDKGEGAFLDTAAVMMHLDLVVTSDTAIAHLAGGLGVPVWLATQYAPDWRWMKDREDSPWYPTMRLFRQTRIEQWGDVFQRMAAALLATRSAPIV